MNSNLRNLQSSIQIALADSQVTPGQIAEIVRETLRTEASKARDAADKAEEALSSLNSSNDFIAFTSDIQAAQPVAFYGGGGQDAISF